MSESESKALTYQDVAEHNTKKDCYIVVYDKVYDCTKFIDEHPGGEEVILDVGGQDATEAFEDVGHSDEAREALDKLYVSDLKRGAGDPAPKSAPNPGANAGNNADGTGLTTAIYAVLAVGGLVAYFAYNYLQQQQEQQQAAP